MNKRSIILLSGGIDSTVLLAKLKKESHNLIALSFSYGQKHEIELDYAKETVKKYEIKEHLILELPKVSFSSSALVNEKLNTSKYKAKKDIPISTVNSYVPYRNMIFLSFALSVAENLDIDKIFIGVNKDDALNYWDCTATFVEKINGLASLSSKVSVEAPFLNSTKREVIKLGNILDVNFNNTISCYNPIDKKECGSCLSCLVKKDALDG